MGWPVNPGLHPGGDSAKLAANKIFREHKGLAGDSREGSVVQEAAIADSAATLLSILGWDDPNVLDSIRSENQELHGTDDPYPGLHVAGYSLGGFLAQSVFFGWPSVVSSCTSLCSGGALSEIELQKFAQPEEWQRVLYGLRYELDNSLAADPADDRDRILGVPAQQFRFFHRIFYDVFLQDFGGQYQGRLAEFVDRMLYIVGGDDPIIQPRTVLDAAPPGGNHLIQIGGLSHFVDDLQPGWQSFWLPNVSRVMGSFARETEGVLVETLKESNRERARSAEQIVADVKSGSRAGRRSNEPDDEPLNSASFQHEMESMLTDLIKLQPHLFVARNRFPTTLLGAPGVEGAALAVHHNEDSVARYARSLREQAFLLSSHPERLTITIAKKAVEWASEPSALIPAYPVSVTPDLDRAKCEAVLAALRTWIDTGAVRLCRFEAINGEDGISHPDDRIEAAARELVRRERTRHFGNGESETALSFESAFQLPVINSLPDVWLEVSHDLLSEVTQRDEGELPKLEGMDREERELWFLQMAAELHSGEQRAAAEAWLTESLRSGRLKALSVSGARFDSRFRGLKLQTSRSVRRSWIHAALAYAYSSPLELFPDLIEALAAEAAGDPG